MEKKLSQKNAKSIRIVGAKEHNLRNVTVEIPRDRLVVVTGPSGSGKSTLAFGVLHAEGQRRYLEGVSSYARNFLDIAGKPNVERIDNLSPTIAIDQKSAARSPRSTVGTMTELNDYIRVLFARLGTVRCPSCKKKLFKKSAREIMEETFAEGKRTVVEVFARVRVARESRESVRRAWEKEGYGHARVAGRAMTIAEAFARTSEEAIAIIDVLTDRYLHSPKRPDKERFIDSVEGAFALSGEIRVCVDGKAEKKYFREYRCDACETVVPEMTPRHFSFNNPEGMCERCNGLGSRLTIDPKLLPVHEKLSLEEGAIGILGRFTGRSRGSVGSFVVLEALGAAGVSPRTPLGRYTEKQKKILFFGDGKNFSGVLAFLEEKHRTSSSDRVRAELEKSMRAEACGACGGKRLRAEALSVTVGEKTIAEWLAEPIERLETFAREALDGVTRTPEEKKIVAAIWEEIVVRVQSLCAIGAGYLAPDRSSQTLSGGEAQRIRLAAQRVVALSGVIYVLDEPSMGLHPRDTHRLIETFQELKNGGNTVVVVEHDADIIAAAEWVVDLGPGAGEQGGKVVFCGDSASFRASDGATAAYAFGKKRIARTTKTRVAKQFLTIKGACEHNLKHIDAHIPLGLLVCVTGVSGSGKSTLAHDILGKALRRHFSHTKDIPGKYARLENIDALDKVVNVGQDPIGRTSRSNVATYTGIFSLIREVYAEVSGAKHFDASRFSFNLKGGRCEVCQGEGTRKIEMYLMPDMYAVCEACNGTRYNAETLSVSYRGETIADVLSMSVSYARRFFASHRPIADRLTMLEKVGLGYVRLGQGAPDLSGGEAQRIKLAKELARKSTGKTLYIFDEPTVGLHFSDVQKLLLVLDELVARGNTVVVVEHNLDMVRCADWVIDMGPEGGEAGGHVVYAGEPAGLKKCKEGWTGKYL